MAEVSQKTKYVKLDDGVSFALVRTNPKLTTNTKLMYNGKRIYLESYASGELLNRTQYKNVSVKSNSVYNKDIANFLTGSGTRAYEVCQNFNDTTISSSYDYQYENMYWCGAEYIDSSFYDEEIGFVAPLYLREKLPNYFAIFRIDTPSNYNLNVDEKGNKLDSVFDFKKDILDKAVLIKTFDLREKSETPLGKYIHNYINQEGFEFDKSMYVNFSKSEVTYYGIDKNEGILVNRVENFNNELLKNDNAILEDDMWFTEGFERNSLIFPYIMNIEYLFDDETFKTKDGETYDFARYIGLYCNTIEFGEFSDFNEFGITEDDIIYYFEDNRNNLHRYVKKIKNIDYVDGSDSDYSDSVNIIDNDAEYEVTIDGKDIELFDNNLISGFEKERVTAYAEPLDIYEGFINRAQYGFEILKPFEPGDWVGIKYTEKDDNGNIVSQHVECYFADDVNRIEGIKPEPDKYQNMKIGEVDGFRFSVSENSTLSDIAESLVKCINQNKKSKFEANYSDNVVVFYAKREGKKYNGNEDSGAKILIESSLVYNKKIYIPMSSDGIYRVSENDSPIENISDSDCVIPAEDSIQSLFGDYYVDYFYGACDVDIDPINYIYKNVFKIYTEEHEFFDVNRYLKTKNGNGRRICSNIIYINTEGKIDNEYRLIIIDDVQDDKIFDSGYDVSVSSTCQVEIMDIFKPNHGILSWFPVKDFDFDINYSSYGQYGAFVDECDKLSKNIVYNQLYNKKDTYADSDSYSNNEESSYEIKKLAKSHFYDDYGKSLDTEYEYYFEQYHPVLCLKSKSVPYISKWGYYDEQKDSCENPYRLNVSKIFGVSNLSANTYMSKCSVDEYTHSMPYYMTFHTPDYKKEYQYIKSDEHYIFHNDVENFSNDSKCLMCMNVDESNRLVFNNMSDCVDYWIKMFMKTDEDIFSKFFSGKKYGKRFDRKYSRLLGGDKFNNPSTLFRGVKFEAVRQFSGVEKRSSEYNNYKFSFVYIPVIVDSFLFTETVRFIKNDTFKFIVGIIFVNTMLGVYDNNIFNGKFDYFNKGFIYAGCMDMILAESSKENKYDLTLIEENNSSDSDFDYKNQICVKDISGSFWDENYEINNIIEVEKNIFHMWIEVEINDDSDSDDYGETMFITKSEKVTNLSDIIGEFNYNKYDSVKYDNLLDYINDYIKNLNDNDENIKYTSVEKSDSKDYDFKVLYERFYNNYDTTIYGYKKVKYYGYLECKYIIPNIKVNEKFIEVCDNEWKYFDKKYNFGYDFDVSKIQFKEGFIRNVLFNIGNVDKNCVVGVNLIYNNGDEPKYIRKFINKNQKDKDYEYKNDEIKCEIIVDSKTGNIKIYKEKEDINKDSITHIQNEGEKNETIENLFITIEIKDVLDVGAQSLGLKNYFSIFNNLSMFNITENINKDIDVKYYSTVEDNKYKIRVIEPDSIEVEDIYEFKPVYVEKNNSMKVGSIKIAPKSNIDKIGIKIINRYSGYYNPIFNDILYYGDYSNEKNTKKLKYDVELPYSNTNIDYNYEDDYGKFGIIKNMCYHKTNVDSTKNYKILALETPVYPAINEYALDYRDYNVFSSNWDDGYFISQDDLNHSSICSGIGSMKDGLCMYGSKYLNVPDYIFIDTFETLNKDNSDIEISYEEINNRTVKYQLFLKNRLKRYLKEKLIGVFSKYINKEYSFGNKGTIEDDVEEYVENNLLKLYKIDKVHMYIKGDRMRIHDKRIENEYLKYVNKDNDFKFKNGFDGVIIGDIGDKNVLKLKDSNFRMNKVSENEFDRTIIYNLKPGFKESFGFEVSFRRK